MGEADGFKFGAQNSPSWIRCSLSCHLRYITPTENGHLSHSLTNTQEKSGGVLWCPLRSEAQSPITKTSKFKSLQVGLQALQECVLCDGEEGQETEMWCTLTFSRLRSRFCLSLSFRMLITILCLAPLVTFCWKKEFCVKHPFSHWQNTGLKD